MRSVCFSSLYEPVKYVKAKLLEGKTVAEICSVHLPEFKFFSIRINNITQPLEKNVILLEKYPDVVIQDPEDPLQYPKSAVIGLADDSSAKYGLGVTIATKPQFNLGFLMIPIPGDQMGNNVKDFLKLVKSSLSLTFASLKFTDLGNFTTIQELFDSNKNEAVKLEGLLVDDDIKAIKQRTNVTYEIIDTEQKFITALEALVNFWRPSLQNCKYYTPEEVSYIFNDIPQMIKVHKDFLYDLKQVHDGYASRMAMVFNHHADQFKVLEHFVANHNLFIDIIHGKSVQCKKFINELASKQNDKDFESFLIEPVQRMPRYQLFVKELRKGTPPPHPDFPYVAVAAAKLQATAKNFDAETAKTKRMQKFYGLQKDVTNKYDLYKQDRLMIDVKDVKITEVGHDSKSSGQIYLFTDIVLLMREQNGKYTVLFDSPCHQFHYMQLDNTTIRVEAVNKEYHQSLMNKNPVVISKVEFKDESERNDFISKVYSAEASFCRNKSGHFLSWKLLNRNELPLTYFNACAILSKEIIMFGGQRTAQRQPTSLLTSICLGNLRLSEIPAYFSGRSGHTLSLVKDGYVVIGGKCKQKLYKKFLLFDLHSRTWSQALPKGIKSFTARYGHTTVSWGHRMVIFGGRAFNNALLNDVVVFDPVKNTLDTIEIKGAVPIGRYHHAACIFGDKMLVHGGKAKGKKLLADLWMLDLSSMVWQQVHELGATLPPRKCHGMAVIGANLVVVGGQTDSPTAPSYAIDLSSFEVRAVTDTGNFPGRLTKFGFCSDGEKMYVFGGLERKGATPSGALIRLDMDRDWLKDAREARVQIGADQSVVQPELGVSALYDESDGDFEELSMLINASEAVEEKSEHFLTFRRIVEQHAKITADDTQEEATVTDEGMSPELRKYIDAVLMQMEEATGADDFYEEEDGIEMEDEVDAEVGEMECMKTNPHADRVRIDTPETVAAKAEVSTDKPIGDVLESLGPAKPRLQKLKRPGSIGPKVRRSKRYSVVIF